MKRMLIALCIVSMPLGCASTEMLRTQHEGHVHLTDLTHAVAVITPTAGNKVRGTVTFQQKGSSVTVTADLTGFEPESEHAWHVHQYGDIRGTDGKTTGGHYNPEGHAHGLPGNNTRHAGDFGNLVADDTGHAKKTVTVDFITIGGHRNPVLGRAIIVHAKLDDGGQPTGNAGARIAQGVIGVAKSE